jgi:hypothetical protein
VQHELRSSSQTNHAYVRAYEYIDSGDGETWARMQTVRLPAVGTLKEYSKDLEYEYRVKTVVLGTLKRYYIISITLY